METMDRVYGNGKNDLGSYRELGQWNQIKRLYILVLSDEFDHVQFNYSGRQTHTLKEHIYIYIYQDSQGDDTKDKVPK